MVSSIFLSTSTLMDQNDLIFRWQTGCANISSETGKIRQLICHIVSIPKVIPVSYFIFVVPLQSFR